MDVSPAIRTALLNRGVVLPCPESVFVDASVRPERFAAGAIVHPGCRLLGPTLSMGPGCVLGEEGPATVEDCQFGADVHFKGGYASHAVLLDGVTIGSCAHIRPDTLLEEDARAGHAVGLKHTILMPFVTLGSLVNFCDCLMAGGTDRRRHGEVGSSYVHFNYTPQRDKATPSLLGDVPRGVMLDCPPIFLGGQGGLVGPARIEFGTVAAAGLVLRGDVLSPDRLILGGHATSVARRDVPCEHGLYGDIRRRAANNLRYIGNLWALLEWYGHARPRLCAAPPWRLACLEGARERLRAAVEERILRLTEWTDNLRQSVADAARLGRDIATPPFRDQAAFARAWPCLAERLRAPDLSAFDAARDAFLKGLGAAPRTDSYTDTIRALPHETRQAGTRWLEAIVRHCAGLWTPGDERTAAS